MTTHIGAIGHEPLYRVDTAGGVSDLGPVLAVDWWVGAEDRWHRASVEHAVRQSLAEDQITIETRLRVPGGDIVARAAGAASSGQGAALLEYQNDTPVPVAVALVVDLPRPSGVTVYDDTLTVDDVPVLRAGRSVARCLLASDRDALLAGLEAGEALPPAELTLPAEARHVALVFPVPHTAVLRVVMSAAGGSHLGAPPDLPPVDAIARGWDLHVGQGARIDIPDERVVRAVAAARRHLLLGSGARLDGPFWSPEVLPAVVAVALDAWGHHAEARELLLRATGTDDLTTHATRNATDAGSLIWAWAEILERRPDRELLDALSGWLTEAAIGLTRRRRGLLRRRDVGGDSGWRAVGLAAAASLLSRVEDSSVGPDLVDALPELVGEIQPDQTSLALALGGRRLDTDLGAPLQDLLALRLDTDADLAAIAACSSPTGAFASPQAGHDPWASALFLLAARRAVVDEPSGTGGPVAFMPGVPAAWWGASMEVHAAPVTGGSVSFGLRWHGERPAALWDLDTAAPVTVMAPSLDPQWSDDRPRAEALLGPTPGLQAEEAPRRAETDQGRIIDTGDGADPDSFS